MRTYNFNQSQKLLRVDPKTFGRWLKKAHIDPAKQVNRADPREKFLTKEQIIMLAREHDRELPDLDEENEPESPVVTLATVDERLAALEQLIIQRFDQVDQCFNRVEAQLRTAIADLQHELATLTQRITLQGNQVEVKPPTIPAAPTTPTRRTQPARKPMKKTTRGRRLPKTLVPLTAFRDEHGISNKAVEYALEKQKFTVERGKWVHNNKRVMIALGLQGQCEFYDLFHMRDGFQRCEKCPHAL